MNYYIFKKENNDFTEFFNDPTLKPLFKFKLKFYQHLILGLEDDSKDGLFSYICLKYGDFLVDTDTMFKNFSPKMHKDYTPDSNRPKKYKDL